MRQSLAAMVYPLIIFARKGTFLGCSIVSFHEPVVKRSTAL
jgi:hypothetical protein